MHDPMTVAFQIRYPWPWPRMSAGKIVLRRDSFITVWHVDPERDGTDDSCGWFRPHLTKDQKSTLKHLGYCETERPWFKRERAKEPLNPSDAEALLRGALIATARAIGISLTIKAATRLACELLHNPMDNMRGSLCLLPGWDTNFKTEEKSARRDLSDAFFLNLGRLLLGRRRPWWKHPRWHLWHWEFQVHPTQALKRWLFSRCCRCGKGFTWGYSPTSGSWHGGGPRWFKSEENIYHHDCDRPADTNSGAEKKQEVKP